MSACPPGVHCRIQLLGPPSIWTSTGHVSAAKPFVFGAALYVGLHRGQPVARTELASLLWPDADGASRGERMRWLMHQLRQSGIPTLARSPQIELGTTEVLLDIDELAAAPTAADALVLARGDLMAGYEPAISDGFSRWVEEVRDGMRSRVLLAMERWLTVARREARWSTVEEIARRMIALDELHEGASLAQVEALVMQGRTDRAAQVLARYRAEVGNPGATPAVRSIQKQLNALSTTDSARPRTPLVGREPVLAQLLDSIDPQRRSHRCVALAGPSGIGKSRTLLEFATAAALRGTRVARVTCTRADALRPISLVVDLAGALLEMRGALGAAPESIEVLRRLLGESGAGAEGETPDIRRAAVYSALHDLLDALVEDGPIAIVADDVQWAEQGSWAVLGPLIGEHPAASWVFGMRMESALAASQLHREMLGAESGNDLIWLTALTGAEVTALCTARAAPRRIPADVMELLIQRAAGIPFVAEALVQHWCDEGELVSLPPSVTRLVGARLERLSPAAARVIEAVSVLGADADAPAIEAVSTLDRGALLDGTRELDSAGILQATDGGVLSAHALWTEAVLARIPRSALQLQHRYAAEWLEHVSGLASVPDHRRHWAIANHWLDAGDPERARRSLDGAADVLLANGFVVQAFVMLERAGDVSGVSESALHYWRRAAHVVALEQTHETQHVRNLQARYDAVARVVLRERYTPHHELEHATLYSANRDQAAQTNYVEAMSRCVLATEASMLHRLAAAESVLKRSTFCEIDRGLLDTVWAAVEPMHPSTALERLRRESCAALYYSRVAGQPAIGLAHALRAREVVRDDESMTRLDFLRVMQLLSNAYEYEGDLDRAQLTRHEWLRVSLEIKSSAYTLECLASLIGTALEAGRPGEARPLLPLFGAERNFSQAQRGVSICRVVCALEEGNVAEARAELDFSLAAADDDIGLMPRARVLAIYAHLALLEDDDVSLRVILPKLLGCFTERLAYMDHPAYVAGRGLERLDGPAAAAAFVDRYLRLLRPERWTPRPELLRLVAPAQSVSA